MSAARPGRQASLPRIPRDAADDFTQEAVEARRALLREVTDGPLPHLEGGRAELASARGKVENLVGHAQVPLGIAGPLLVDTSLGWREVFVPMATTEGAMVAAYSRGMAILKRAGGARARQTREGLTQNPILVFPDARRAEEAACTIRARLEPMQAITAATTGHGRLESLAAEVLGRRVILRLLFTTGDAIGINMASRATDLCLAELARETGAEAHYVHGQDVEKRANARALIEGRGRSVVCDATVPRALLAESARTTPEDLVAIQQSYTVGFAQLGTQNWTIQAANGLAAVMLACGQDVAYVTECATGQLDFHVTESGDLYLSVWLPSLLVGTVGGGTGQCTAAECLDVLGCRGEGKARHLAELLGAIVLAGDLSLMAAFCTHEFSSAHERLGRNRPPAPDSEGTP
ncbi:MAG: hydroxymethylglutaryl-CoA reductase [Planctomycetota bacterium]|nr:hydroxymethylglutaryl-CoA reductase [Planctomycetota bacterium]